MNTKLDDQLKQWHTAHAPSEQSRNALRSRILRDLQYKAEPATQTEPESPILSRGWMPKTALGFALAALLALTTWIWMTPSAQQTAPSFAQTRAESWITPPYALAALYKESKILFGGALEWVAQSGQDVEMGLESDSSAKSPPLPSDSAYALTIAIVTRQNGATRVVWKSDIIARSEAWVNIPSALTKNVKLSTWFCRVGGGKLAVDSQWTVCKTKTITGGTSQIVDEGKPVEVGTFTCDGVDYEILQIARPIEKMTEGGSC